MIQYLLLGGQILVVVLIYVFVWRVMRFAKQDISGAAVARGTDFSHQESTIIPAQSAAKARRAAGLTEPRIVVVSSPVLREGVPYSIGAQGLTLGRTDANDIVLAEPTVSTQHARIVAPETFIDGGSTNGSYVNGQTVHARWRLQHGDQIQIGNTLFRYERA